MSPIARLQRYSACALALGLVLGAGLSKAEAFWYETEDFRIDIPEEEHAYYYTPKGTNMTGTMLERAQEQEMECLIGVYGADGKLSFTFRVEKRAGTAEDTAASFSQDGNDTMMELDGRMGWSISKEKAQDSNYASKYYVFDGADSSESFLISTQYLAEDGSDALEAMETLLNTVSWAEGNNTGYMENGAELGSGAENGGVSETFSSADNLGVDPGTASGSEDDSSALEESFGRDPDAVPMPGADTPALSPVSEPGETTEATEFDTTPAALEPVSGADNFIDRLGEQFGGLLSGLSANKTTVLLVAGVVLALAIIGVLAKILADSRRYTPRHGANQRRRSGRYSE